MIGSLHLGQHQRARGRRVCGPLCGIRHTQVQGNLGCAGQVFLQQCALQRRRFGCGCSLYDQACRARLPNQPDDGGLQHDLPRAACAADCSGYCQRGVALQW